MPGWNWQKNLANAKQHPEATTLSSENNISYPKKQAKEQKNRSQKTDHIGKT